MKIPSILRRAFRAPSHEVADKDFTQPASLSLTFHEKSKTEVITCEDFENFAISLRDIFSAAGYTNRESKYGNFVRFQKEPMGFVTLDVFGPTKVKDNRFFDALATYETNYLSLYSWHRQKGFTLNAGKHRFQPNQTIGKKITDIEHPKVSPDNWRPDDYDVEDFKWAEANVALLSMERWLSQPKDSLGLTGDDRSLMQDLVRMGGLTSYE